MPRFPLRTVRPVPPVSVRRSFLVWRWLALLALLAGAFAPPARAQAGPVLTGTVTGPGGRPVAGAVVRATGDDGRPAGARTDAAGRFRLVLPAGSARWAVSVEAPGMQSRTVVVSAAGGRVAPLEVALEQRVVRLAPVTARATRPSEARPRATGGERTSNTLPTSSELFPVEGGELADVAALNAGVLAVPGAEEGTGISIAGQPASQTGTTLDGASYGSSSLPTEAVGGTRVVSSSFDVARGQYSGGQVAATTRAGGPRWGGAVGGSARGAPLRFGDLPGAGAGRENRWARVDAGGGGPLVRGRLFAYGALQATSRAGDFALLDTADADGLRRLEVSPDSARRFGRIAAGLGLPAARARGSGADAGSGVLRLDWRLPGTHDLMARLDWRGTRSTGLGGSEFALAGSAGEQRSRDAGALVQLASAWGDWTHVLRAYAAGGSRTTEPGYAGPAGRVRVVSDLDEDDGRGVATLQFGGNPFLASRTRNALREISDEAVFAPASGTHQVKAGLLYQEESAGQSGDANERGTFFFNSLAELEAGVPSRFARALGGPAREVDARYAAAWLGDTWRPQPAFSLTYGARLERAWYPDAPGVTPSVASGFGGGGARIPAETRVSPRAGFTWRMPKRGAVLATVRGGVGQFRGKLPLRPLAAALGETGAAARSLVCLGDAAPRPAWATYAADPGSVPAACADGAGGVSSRLPAATLFAPGFGAPRVWNGTLGAESTIRDRYFLTVEGTVARGLGQPLARDLNLGPAAGALAGEGGRPLYAAPSRIHPFGGAADPAASRRLADLGVVREVSANGSSWTGQLKLEGHTLIARSSALTLNYTWTRSTDVATGISAPGGATATTAGDPLRRERAPADVEQRHVLQAVMTRRVSRLLDVGMVARVASGFPFSPMVDGDVNGDGVFNDRAFVFDRRSAPAEVAAGMERLLRQAPGSAAACLRRQMGRVAGRNSCRTPWSPSLDLRFNFRPKASTTPRRFRGTIIASNLTAGLDYLLHGADGLRGWGQVPLPDRTLLYTRSWDPAAGAYRYEVNPGFGRVAGTRGAGRIPFSLTFQGRIALGPDPAFQPLAGAIAGTRQNNNTPQVLRPALATRLPNVPAQVLALNGPRGLQLTPEQAQRMLDAAAQVEARLGPARDTLVALLSAPLAQRAAAQERITALGREAQQAMDAGMEAARAVLNAEQWRRLPAELTQPRSDAPLVPPQRIEFSGS
ncbi:MAG TPA: carboxypeptidase regulatory-like domain-containing protein [Longimicrobium sp.]|uniref:carboxypeptidase regulatory-like domain-containing protein n=1 Tax=Longimicrobium sp. TaxID=2029185 RepID=UPI002EDB641E